RQIRFHPKKKRNACIDCTPLWCILGTWYIFPFPVQRGMINVCFQLGGHYVAYTALPDAEHLQNPEPSNEKNDGTRRRRQWAYISDTVVRLTTLEEVLKAKA